MVHNDLTWRLCVSPCKRWGAYLAEWACIYVLIRNRWVLNALLFTRSWVTVHQRLWYRHGELEIIWRDSNPTKKQKWIWVTRYILLNWLTAAQVMCFVAIYLSISSPQSMSTYFLRGAVRDHWREISYILSIRVTKYQIQMPAEYQHTKRVFTSDLHTYLLSSIYERNADWPPEYKEKKAYCNIAHMCRHC